MSRELSRRKVAAVRAWHEGLHGTLDRGRRSGTASYAVSLPPSGRVVEHCCNAMAAVRVQPGTRGSSDDPTVDVRIMLRWGAFEAELSQPDDPGGEWVLRLEARETASGEPEILAAALRQAADLIEADGGHHNGAHVSDLPYWTARRCGEAESARSTQDGKPG